MTINLVMGGQTLAIEPLEVQGIPRSGDYIRTDDMGGGQYIVLFAAYMVGQDAVMFMWSAPLKLNPSIDFALTLRAIKPARLEKAPRGRWPLTF